MSDGSESLLDVDKIKELSLLVARCGVNESRGLVDPLFELLLGRKLNLKEDLFIQDPNVILLLFELLPQLSETVQFEILSTLNGVIRSCHQNLQICLELSIIKSLLLLLKSSVSVKIAAQIGSLIEAVASYSISSNDLKAILVYLNVSNNTWTPHSKVALKALNSLSTLVVPTAFFSFSGLPGAVITLPPLSKWSSQSGFTFYTWICFEKPTDSRRDLHKPIILWFRTRKKLGFSLHLDGNQLVIEVQSKISKKSLTYPVNFFLQTNQWYMMALVYQHHLIRSSELQYFIDGKLVLQADCTMPHTSDVFDKCFLGSSPSGTADSVFRGKMTAVYFFKEPQSSNVISCLYKLGPGYCGQFKFASESDVLLADHEKKALCPMLSQLDYGRDKDAIVDKTLSSKLVSLILNMTKNSASYLTQLVQIKAFQLIGHLLEKASPIHLTEELCSNFLDFVRYLFSIPNGKEPLKQLLLHVIFNAALWIKAEKNVQLLLYTHIALNYGMEPHSDSGWDLRELITVQHIVYIIRKYYSYLEEADTDGNHVELCTEIRPYLILTIKQFVTRKKGITGDELVSILDYIATAKGMNNLKDILELLIALMFEGKSITHLLIDNDGITNCLHVLCAKEKLIQCYGLKLICKIIHDTQQSKYTTLHQQILFKVNQKFHEMPDPMSIGVFNCFYELMICAPTRYVIDGHFVPLEDSHTIVNSYVLSILAELLSIPHTDDTASSEIFKSIKLQVLSSLYALCYKNKDNCKALLKDPGWLKSLILLSDLESSDDLTELKYKVINVLLQYCMENMQDGWKAWVKVASWLHTHTQAHDSGDQQSEYLKMFQSFDSLSLSDLQVITDQPIGKPSPSITDDSDSAPPQHAEETSEDDNNVESVSQLDESPEESIPESYEALPSPVSVKTSVSFSGKKVGKFMWTGGHFRILADILEFIWKIIKKWKSLSEKQYEELYKGNANMVFLSNTAHLLALSVDGVIIQTGGLKSLLSLSTKKSSKKAMEFDTMIPRILRLCVDISKVIVLEGRLKFSVVEGRLRMPPAGMQRQCLRLVLCLASLDVIDNNAKFEEQRINYYCLKADYQQLHHEADELLGYLGYQDLNISKFLHSKIVEQGTELTNCQCCLNQGVISTLQLILTASHVDTKATDAMVFCIVYYLSVMSATCYKAILESTDVHPVEPVKQVYATFSRESLSGVGIDDESVTNDDSMRSHSDSKESSPSRLYSDNIKVVTSPSSSLRYQVSSSSVSSTTVDLSEQLDATLAVIAPYLCQLFKKFKTLLSKTFVGTSGKPVLVDALPVFQESCTAAELAMSLCSQELHLAIKSAAAKIFQELIDEGKQLVTFCDSYMRSIADSELDIVKESFKQYFQIISQGNQTMADYLTKSSERTSENDHINVTALARHNVASVNEWKMLMQSVNEEGILETLSTSTSDASSGFWKLCLTEDSSRRRLKLVENSRGTAHLQASRNKAVADTSDSGTVQVQPTNYQWNTENEDILEVLIDDEDTSESIGSSFLTMSCSILLMADAIPGTLTFGKSSFSFNPKDTTEVSNYLDTSCVEKWWYADVTAVFSRLYLHQRRAAEVFFCNQMATFFVFDNFQALKQFVKRLPKVGVGKLYGLPITRSISLASSLQLFKKSNMSSRWQKREITNFDYLMFLNTISGRSYNDLGQYPVFPWILNDYCSQELDLNNPKVYRDLSKPIGLLNPDRLEQFKTRYDFMDDDMPKFLFGTHYSTMAYTLHWLIRVEPYSSLHIEFNGGYFDDPNRVFSSMEETWKNCLESTSDVRELIPELFFLPQMFVNDNKFELGVNHFGEAIGNVKLPPWANSPEEFIRIHKEALESDYVSDNLHHWIDLVFGYKQNGRAAVEAQNLFYYLTYPGCINLETLDDASLKKSLEEQIKSFGQMPNQLLKDSHPLRNQPVKIISQCLPATSSEVLSKLEVSPDVAIIMLHPEETYSYPRTILSLSASYVYCAANWNVTEVKRQPTCLLEVNVINSLKQRGILFTEASDTKLFCTATLDNQFLFTCGVSNNSFQIYNTETGQLIQSVFGHHSTVLCLDYNQDRGLCSNNEDGLVASGSCDCTVMLWKWSGQKCRIISSTSESMKSTTEPIAVLTGHHTPVVSVALNCSLGIVASGALSAFALLHNTKGDLLCKLSTTSNDVYNVLPKSTIITNDGNVIVQYVGGDGGLIIRYSCNGQKLSTWTLKENILQLTAPNFPQTFLTLTLTTDGKYVAVGCVGNTIAIIKLSNFKIIYNYKSLSANATVLRFSENNQVLFAGTSLGSIVALSTHMWIN
ncbi:neurobeachin-like isoform X3 [Dysidea avara]|uniref:neurobeachin-like isoform X3 n=1 Tax=Dysidea avara TaxID=196820 RepID=UPI00331F705C